MTQWKVAPSVSMTMPINDGPLSLPPSPPPSPSSQAKGATDNRDLVRLGLFAYPVLMAADVLLYK